jgi:hypothetical protein
MRNLLDAIVSIHKQSNLTISDFYKSRNRANNMGEALELFVQDAFADTFDKTNSEQVDLAKSKVFSYIGNQNNPPDAIVRNGDAIEIKKIESFGSALALNSSYPKDKLRARSPMITKACRECEQWQEKDIIYAVGVVGKKNILALCFVYGEDYAASHEVYEKLKTDIKNGINAIPNVEFVETNELGHVNRVDPLGITYLRIRGMWGIENPLKVFNALNGGNYFAIINNAKYNAFPQESRKIIENTKGISVTNCKIKNSNNPAQLKDAKLISFRSTK